MVYSVNKLNTNMLNIKMYIQGAIIKLTYICPA